jgi:hypothetical protein
MTRESQVEKYLVWTVERMGGIAYKFQSVNHRGVSDRIVCLPDGSTWFIEVKATKGRLSPLQKIFALEMKRLNQKYACLWSQSEIDEWASHLGDTSSRP